MSVALSEVLGEDAGAARDRVLERLRTYVEQESPSGDADRIEELAAMIAQDFRAANASAESVDADGMGEHVVARLKGITDGPHVLVLCHMDTVHPVGTLAKQPFAVQDGRATGPGIYDMKAGIALVVEALHLLARKGNRPNRDVRVLVTADEEVGSNTSRALIEESAEGAFATLVMEPCLPGGLAKSARKGVASYKVEVIGRAAHAGVEPEKGINAIHELVLQIPRMLELANPAAGSTVSVGTIRGGTAVNVVAAHAQAEVDVRYGSAAEALRIDTAMKNLASITGAELRVQVQDARPPLERTAGVIALYEQARAIAQELGHELGEGGTGGGSDGCFTAALGIPTLDGLSADGGGAHATHEHILVDDLPFRLALLTRMLERL